MVFLNEDEIRTMTGEGHEKGSGILAGQGAGIVAVTMGGKGCWVRHGDETFTAAAADVKALDTTGAGDAFNAGFLYGLVQERDVRECAALGNAVAARCIRHPGARDGLPCEKDLRSCGL